MDHLLEHEGEVVPASGGGAGTSESSTGQDGAPMDVDDEDADAAALGIGVGEGVEAKVRLQRALWYMRRELGFFVPPRTVLTALSPPCR